MSEREYRKDQIAYLLCGLPGSGKTTFIDRHLSEPTLRKFSIDEAMYDRHGIYGVDYPHEVYKTLEKEVYTDLDQQLRIALHMGSSVVLDYGLWTRSERDKYKMILEDCAVDWRLLYFKADSDVLRERLEKRNRQIGANALHVDAQLFERMHQKFEEPKDEGEIVLNAGSNIDKLPFEIRRSYTA